MSENSITTFKDALQVLEGFTSNTFVCKHWIPSLQTEIVLKELNAKQQKKLLAAAMDSSSGSYKPFFIKAFYDIILENCIEGRELIDSISYIDRLLLSVSVRSQSSDTLKINFSETGEELVALPPLLESIRKYKHPESVFIKLEKNSIPIEIEIKVPSFKTEVDYLNATPNFQKIKDETETLKALITESYIYETSKYVETLKINDIDLNYSKLTVAQKYTIFEKLPVIIPQLILEKIAVWKKEIDELLTVTSSAGESKTLDIDSILFLTT